jgi:hypothetical protein
MTHAPDDNVNVTDYHPGNPWGASCVWHHHGAVAVGLCFAHIQAYPDGPDDALWLKAKAVAAGVFQVHLDTDNPVSDSGLLAAIGATMVPMLYAYMKAFREQLRYERGRVQPSRSGRA